MTATPPPAPDRAAAPADAVAIIPARWGSERFPGKPLADETGRPLVAHVVERAAAASCVARVVVATDDERIAAAARAAGAEAVLTRADHPNGTSRLAEAVRRLGLDARPDAIVINVQGDEPEMDPAHLDAAVAALRAGSASVATLATPFDLEAEGADPADPAAVKVVLDERGRALYFSRSLIPSPARASAEEASSLAPPLRHVGLYVYRVGFLLEYAGWAAGRLERVERLEQLRILERGHAIAVAIVDTARPGIDTPEQYAAFVARERAAAAAAAASPPSSAGGVG